MPNFFTQYQILPIYISTTSLVLLILGILSLPYLVRLIPSNYFLSAYKHKKPLLLVCVLRNIIGLILLLARLVMLVLPRRGILTIILAFLLMDFPKKYKLEQMLIRNNAVFNGLNWLRKHYGYPLIKC